jgi:hypothetical protein
VSTRPTAKAPAQPWLAAAARATYVAFIGCGFTFASWASRIPQVRDRLQLTSAELGLVLLTIAAGVVEAVVVPAAVRSFIPDVDDPDAEPGAADARGTTASALRRWREPRTLLVGIVVLAFAFAEGAGIDWISLSLIDGYRQPAVVGTLGFAAFLAAMTIGRWFADGLLARYGRAGVIRGQTVLAIAGVLLLVFSPATPWPWPVCCCGEWAPLSASPSA